MSTTTTFAIGLPPASFTRPESVTVARGLAVASTGAPIVSAGEMGVGTGVSGAAMAGVESGVGVGSGEEVGSAAGGTVEPGDEASGDGVASGVAGAASGDGDKEGVEGGVGAESATGVTETGGVAAGVLSGNEGG